MREASHNSTRASVASASRLHGRARAALLEPVDEWTVDQLVVHARESIAGTRETIDPRVFERFRRAKALT